VPDEAPSSTPLVLTLSGELDVASANEVVARGEALLGDAVAGQRLVIDLGRVEFIDSSGLSGLLRVRRLAVERGSSISLREVSPDVAMLLRLTGIEQLLPTE